MQFAGYDIQFADGMLEVNDGDESVAFDPPHKAIAGLVAEMVQRGTECVVSVRRPLPRYAEGEQRSPRVVCAPVTTVTVGEEKLTLASKRRCWSLTVERKEVVFLG